MYKHILYLYKHIYGGICSVCICMYLYLYKYIYCEVYVAYIYSYTRLST